MVSPDPPDPPPDPQIIGQGLLHNEWRDYILTPRN